MRFFVIQLLGIITIDHCGCDVVVALAYHSILISLRITIRAIRRGKAHIVKTEANNWVPQLCASITGADKKIYKSLSMASNWQSRNFPSVYHK